ncbi:MAG TPA: N,N-dimethylformamidase beta subunit family domain-containing protein [Ilumatobacteraceae bacterium]|nr:N,N-dimethylformamidase beta subunit family domain-containing protein [Ilumatobacteraceae bacterium]
MAYETVTGYCWPQSVAGGERVALHVSSSGARPFDVEVAHIGATRTVVYSEADIPAGDHPTPLDAPERGCAWPAASEVAVEPEWPSGYYEVILTIDADGKARRTRAFFVVRPDLDTTTARILLALSTNTWNAYNDFGGRNLYTGATSVSMQRPMAPGYLYKPPGAGQRVTSLYPPDPHSASHVGYLRMNHLSPYGGSAGWPNWELPFVEWAGREGYGIDVVTNADLEEHPELLGDASPYGLYLSIGHDEYWSGPMRDTVEGFIARGGNAAFLSGNTAFWQVRHEDPSGDDGSGPAATMVGYKGFFKRDPVYGTDRQSELTTIWSDRILERPENHMTGVSFSRGGYHRIGKRVTNGAGGYTLHRPEHWIFDGTGLDYGDVLGAAATIVGYECDGCDFTYRDGLPYPTGDDGTPANFEILGSAPAAHFTRTTSSRPPASHELAEDEGIALRLFGTRDPAGVERIAHGHAILGTYVSPGGGTVITSGSTDWVWGLAERDRHVEQITRNILNRLS